MLPRDTMIFHDVAYNCSSWPWGFFKPLINVPLLSLIFHAQLALDLRVVVSTKKIFVSVCMDKKKDVGRM